VPRINDELLDAVVFLYPSEADAEDGKRIGGSGFLYGVRIEGTKKVALFVVTNKHVINSGAMVVRINTLDGGKDTVPLDGSEWFSHPDGDDLAVCPVGVNTSHHRVSYIDSGSNLKRQFVRDFNIGIGDDTFMIGRFIGFEGKQQNLPSARFGNIAQMPIEPIIVDGFPQEAFLIEARSIPGYSGSPVFITIEPHGKPPVLLSGNAPPDFLERVIKQSGYMKERAGAMRFGPFLLGVDFCHLYDRQKIWSDKTGEPVDHNWHVRSNSGMMGVIPAWKLSEMFDINPKLKAVFNGIATAARSEA
jgi:hypothetical protein